MAAVVSILTPVNASSIPWLGETASSIAELRAALAGTGIALEWVVCFDGCAPVEIAAERIVAWQRGGSAAIARTACLAAASGELVLPLDADDLLAGASAAEAVVFAVEQLAAGSAAGWCAFNRVLLDGRRTPHWYEQPAAYAPGELAAAWRSPFPFHPNSLIVRRELALAVGGWPALPVAADLGFALALSEQAAGLRSPQILTRYRVWEGQTTAAASYVSDKQPAFRVIEALVNARRALHGRPAVKAPVPGVAHGRLAAPDAGGDR